MLQQFIANLANTIFNNTYCRVKPMSGSFNDQTPRDLQKMLQESRRSELISFLKVIQLIALIMSVYRYLFGDDISQEPIRDTAVIRPLISVIIAQGLKCSAKKSAEKLNLIGILIINMSAFMSYIYMILQIYMVILIDVSWKIVFGNFALLYGYYIMHHYFILSCEKISGNLFLGILVYLFIVAKILFFKEQLQNQVYDLFKQVVDAETNIKNVLDILPEGIIIFDQNFSTIQYANNSMFKIAFQREQQIENSQQSTSRVKDNFSQQQHLSNKNNDFNELLTEVLNWRVKIRKPMSILVEIQVQNFNKCSQKLVMIRDITVFKQKEQAQAEKQVQTVLFASVAHDIRTPLNSLLASNTSLISSFYDQPINQQIHKSLLIQKSSIQFLINIVEDILDLSKFQLGNFQLSNSWFSFHQVVEEIFEMSEFLASQKKIKLIQILEINQNVQIFSDKKRLKQVLVNLVNNAIKFTQKGFVKVRAYFRPCDELLIADCTQKFSEKISLIDLDRDQSIDDLSPMMASISEIYNYNSNNRVQSQTIPLIKRGELVVQVIDSGVGINKNDQENLFKIFGKNKTSQHISQQGVGLGLNICQRICENLGGKIKMESQENVGSTFTFNIIIDQLRQVESVLNSDDTLADKYQRSLMMQNPFSLSQNNMHNSSFVSAETRLSLTQRINPKRNLLCLDDCFSALIIDDNHFNIMAMNLMLEQIYKNLQVEFQPSIESAVDGQDGLQKMKLDGIQKCCDRVFKLIIVDMNMPVMSGIEMMKHVRDSQKIHGYFKAYANSTFVLCTAQNEMIEQNFEELGFDYFSKQQILCLCKQISYSSETD
ncbi:multi-sensor hybrid histidine kinase [Stylonychia lemnae]|uniref:histidine kinase n=1 Tax=Stylonychia lemnae TaxID=5949 RepID=A0A078AN24_STYLE|nr:multi-sensor hybrid histidine kinase [Stylonychia lemnae]|eukprot:CDW82762.1 multi-sensor hybrid histidine kinase [Stylonychia lemnae]